MPTTWGGYDKFPIRAKYFANGSKTYMAMSGKFHTAWGEFGGFKHPDAIRFEAACMVAFGASIPFFNAPSAVILQEHVEQEYLGRVFSILTMISTSVMPLGMLVFGPLAEVVRIEWQLLATGALMLLVGILALGNRRLVEAGMKVERAPAVQDGAH